MNEWLMTGAWAVIVLAIFAGGWMAGVKAERDRAKKD